MAQPIAPFTASNLSAPHGFFTKRGGVSGGVYASLQCGWGAKDDPLQNVVENRARVAQALGAQPESLCNCYQVHSARAVIVEEPFAPENAPQADGMATSAPGVTLAALSADCAPVLFEDREAGVVGACHAGWRGAFSGVIEATLAAMVQLGAKPKRVCAAIGPCIGPEAYEVGPEYYANFLEADAANAAYFSAADPQGRRYFNLPSYAQGRLAAAGVLSAKWIERCTYSQDDLFFSYRRSQHRQQPDYGRLISAIRVWDSTS